MISILKMLPMQDGEDPTVYTATNIIWWDDIQYNYHVIEWEPVE